MEGPGIGPRKICHLGVSEVMNVCPPRRPCQGIATRDESFVIRSVSRKGRGRRNYQLPTTSRAAS